MFSTGFHDNAFFIFWTDCCGSSHCHWTSLLSSLDKGSIFLTQFLNMFSKIFWQAQELAHLFDILQNWHLQNCSSCLKNQVVFHRKHGFWNDLVEIITTSMQGNAIVFRCFPNTVFIIFYQTSGERETPTGILIKLLWPSGATKAVDSIESSGVGIEKIRNHVKSYKVCIST